MRRSDAEILPDHQICHIMTATWRKRALTYQPLSFDLETSMPSFPIHPVQNYWSRDRTETGDLAWVSVPKGKGVEAEHVEICII